MRLPHVPSPEAREMIVKRWLHLEAFSGIPWETAPPTFSSLPPLIATLTTSLFQCVKILKRISKEVFPPLLRSTLTDPRLYVIDGHRHLPRSGINEALSEEHDFQDCSEPLFSMYLKFGEEEDNKMVERWQKDAKEILLFVSPVSPFMQIHNELENRQVYFLPQLLRCLL